MPISHAWKGTGVKIVAASSIETTHELSRRDLSLANGRSSDTSCSRRSPRSWSRGWWPFTRSGGRAATDSSHFRYAFDPVCLAAIALFALNRWCLKPAGIAPAFTHGYVNDLLCLPIFVPLSLLFQRCIHLRRHDRAPLAWEIGQHWLVFSILFECVIPRVPGFRSTADPWDVLAYLVGGVIAWLGWRRRTL